jgi:RHS repeat-associated protein
MRSNRETLLCRYFYDPLNRLTACTPSKEASTQRFYFKDRLATEVQGAVQRSIVQHEDQLLAQQTRQNGKTETAMLATDQQRSVLNVFAAARPNLLAYTPYGHRPPENGLLSLLGFNGERPDPVTGCYLLGNGYRAFNPVLMRFNSPDSWSPFGDGGVNAYAYCVGNPVNSQDPTGHSNRLLSMFKGIGNRLNIRTPSRTRQITGAASMENVVRQGSNIAAVTELNPPPPYSPPRTRHPSLQRPTDPEPALSTESELLAEISRREADASIQRSMLNDVENGYLPQTPDEHANRVARWHRTRIDIVQLKEKIPPPSYQSASNPDALPDYQSAIRRS